MLIDWNTLPAVAGMRAGSSRGGICADKISAVRIETAADAEFDGKTHWHENEQILVMVSGLCKLIVDGKELEAHAGGMVFFPARSRHAAIGTGRKDAFTTRFSRRRVQTSFRVGSVRSC